MISFLSRIPFLGIAAGVVCFLADAAGYTSWQSIGFYFLLAVLFDFSNWLERLLKSEGY